MLALSGFHYQGYAGKIQFNREWPEILTHLSQICEHGRESVGSNMILLSVKLEKWQRMGGKDKDGHDWKRK